MNRKITLMVQGTTSDAGKSTVVTGLCRLLARRGVRVAPFKPQNMALNSAVTTDGGEIGRAQAVQAQACYLEPHTDFNPILLKPNSDRGAQVIVHGKSIGNMNARVYHHYKKTAMKAVLASYRRLTAQFDAVIVEGAGSPAEINLRTNDIANMGFAEAADCPVILVADIDKGGVFAHLVGTLELLSESEQARVIGFVINKFRGDPALLQSGLDWLEQRTGKPVLGVLPYLQGLYLEAEDALPKAVDNAKSSRQFRIVVPALPRISNHTDFDMLRLDPNVELIFVRANETVPPADLMILPGSKSVCSDLTWLREHGWEAAIDRHLRYGGKLIGICGGFQMLGKLIHDPSHLESQTDSVKGLGYLDMETSLAAEKQLRNVTGRLSFDNASVRGYEIHMGVSTGAALLQPAVMLSHGADGAMSSDRQIFGTYVHGIFDHPEAYQSLLTWAGMTPTKVSDQVELREKGIDAVADMIEKYVCLPELLTDAKVEYA